jgi:prolyl oligopeptidase
MKLLLLLSTLLALAVQAPVRAQAADPFLWLEDVQGERALAWVRQRNAESEKRLHAAPGFEALQGQLQAVLDSSAQIPYVQRQGNHFYNLWKDAQHPRGLWRRTTLDEYRKPQPAWDTVLDLDALARDEKENWVWARANCLGPSYRRCLLQLSRGGADATITREFDTTARRFVEGGFTLPEAKASVEWASADSIYVGTDFGPGSLTTSGYPRLLKQWQRGTPLASATTVFEGQPGDVSVAVEIDRTPGFERTLFVRGPAFFSRQVWLLQGAKLQRLDLPDDVQLTSWGPRLLLRLRSGWTVGGSSWPAGSLLVADAGAFLAGERKLVPLFTPTATRALTSLATAGDAVLLTVSDNVASRLEEWRWTEQAWQRRAVDAPFPGALTATTLFDPQLHDDPLAGAYLLNVANFLQPDTLQLGRIGSDSRELLKSRPSFYDATGMRVEQLFATSKDGTRVPYFVIWPRGASASGDNPTLLTAYGGFQVSLRPAYSGLQGLGWTTRGGVYVLANLRGGGEFGPAWHQAAMKANKQKSYDDLIAVAEDLVARKITSPRHLGIQGGSNGGLLVGAVMLQRPDLFNAVVCQVPLLDMQRYHLLLAGASWMAEYGNPDLPEEWAYIRKYSPYQNVVAGKTYPTVLFTTSTRDDRVHPGHARKMAARMLEQGHPLLYWENTEGGHAGAADSRQRAHKAALEYSFLWQQLGAK